MDRELKIKVVLDRSAVPAQAQAVAAEVGKANRAASAETKRLAKEEAKAAKEAAAEAARAARDAAKQKTEAEREAARVIQGLARERAKAEAASAREAARESARAARESAKQKTDAEREAARVIQGLTRERAKAETAAARDAARESVRETARAARDIARIHREFAREDAKRQRDELSRLKESHDEASSAARSVAAFATGLLGLGSASAAVGQVLGHFREVNAAIFDAGEFVSRYHEALKELSALRGDLGGTTKAMAQEVDFRRQTLQSAEDARAYQATITGVGASSVKAGLISQAELDKASVMGGKHQAAEGGSAKAGAALVASIPMMMGKKNATAEDVTRQYHQIYGILQLGGPQFSELLPQLTERAALADPTVGAFKGPELASLLSAFSRNRGAAQAGTMVDQFVRATLGGIDREGKPRIAGAEGLGPYYKKIGVTKEMVDTTDRTQLAFQIGDMITEDLKRAEAEARSKGIAFHPDVYLKHHGFANIEDLGAVKDVASMKMQGTFQAFLDMAKPEAEPTMKDIEGTIAEAQRKSPAVQTRKKEMASDFVNVAIGAKQKVLNDIKSMGFDYLKSEGKIGGDFVDKMKAGWLDDVLTGDKAKINERAQHLALEEAARVGVDTPEVRGFIAGGRRQVGQYMGDEALYQLIKKTVAKKGDVLPGVGPLAEKATAALSEQSEFEGNGPLPGLGGPMVGGDGAPAVKALNKIGNILDERLAPAGRPKPIVKMEPAQRR